MTLANHGLHYRQIDATKAPDSRNFQVGVVPDPALETGLRRMGLRPLPIQDAMHYGKCGKGVIPGARRAYYLGPRPAQLRTTRHGQLEFPCYVVERDQRAVLLSSHSFD